MTRTATFAHAAQNPSFKALADLEKRAMRFVSNPWPATRNMTFFLGLAASIGHVTGGVELPQAFETDDAQAVSFDVASEEVAQPRAEDDPNFIPTPSADYRPRNLRLPQYGDPALFVNFAACPNKPFIGNNADTALVPASLTKVMTLYLIASALNDPASGLTPDTMIPITQTAVDQARGLAYYKNADGSPRLRVGVSYSLEMLTQMAGASSEAIATNALAIAYGHAYRWNGSDVSILRRFPSVMNDTAQEIGMQDTVYANATGNHGNRATLRDINRLFMVFQNRFPEDMSMMLGNARIDTGRVTGVRPASSRALSRRVIIDGEQVEILDAKTGMLSGEYNEALMFITGDGSRAAASMIGVNGSSPQNAMSNRAEAMKTLIEEAYHVDVQAFCHAPA